MCLSPNIRKWYFDSQLPSHELGLSYYTNHGGLAIWWIVCQKYVEFPNIQIPPIVCEGGEQGLNISLP